jgi:hypothetical protein
MDRACMERIGSHYAVLLHDDRLRNTVAERKDSGRWRPSGLILANSTGRVRDFVGDLWLRIVGIRQARRPGIADT